MPEKPYLVVKRDRNGWDVEQYATLDEAAAHREILLGCRLDEVFLAKRVRTRVVEYDDTNGGGLGGADLRRVIAQVMSDGHEWHYQDVYRELRERGLSVRGVDPLATLLTQLARVPGIAPVPPNRSGRYRLKATA